LKILSVHNVYRQGGGEDVVVDQESQLLRAHGHEVIEYRRSNKERGDDLLSKLYFARQSLWSRKAAAEIEALICRRKPDVAHFHNTFPLISPSSYWVCKRLGVPVVQTIHNYRMTCVRGDYFRADHICEECLGWKGPLPAVVHGCYRDSVAQTAAAAVVLSIHRVLGTWRELVDVFLALTEFGRMKLIEAGVEPGKIVIKPNFVHPDPGFRKERPTDYALFAGRLSPEKRILTLVKAWEKIKNISLLIVGDGPKKDEISNAIEREELANVRMVGALPRKELLKMMKGATLLLVPSEWYEMSPMVIVEAFACGVPVVASRLGGMAELISDQKTGLLVRPGAVEDIRTKVAWASEHPEGLRQISDNARQVFETRYTAEVNYPLILRAYELALRRAEQTGQAERFVRDSRLGR
jgi:glycosyltransferase involved in cell wall biosynthesis